MKTQTRLDGDTLIVERIYDAPVADVFDAWINASKTTHWWGCGQTTKVVSTIQDRLGGSYRHLMSLDGVGDHAVEGTITEYEPPTLLAYRMPGVFQEADMSVRVTFEAVADGTKVTLKQTPLSEPLQKIVSNGWRAAFERLQEFFEGARRAA
ncbi:MAG: SRPBCC domain-containing protein [Pseudomonadota bacterium]